MAYLLKSIQTTVKTGAYTASFGETVRCDPSGGAFTVTLPTPTVNDVGRQLRVKNVTGSANNITVDGAGANIDGAATFILSGAYVALIFEWDGAEWHAMAAYPFSNLPVTFPAAGITGSHTLPDGVLSTNVPLKNTANTFSATQTFPAGAFIADMFPTVGVNGSWIDMPTASSACSGIGSGGAGVNPWIAIVGLSGAYLSDASVGDTAIRNTTGSIRMGISSGASKVQIFSGGSVGFIGAKVIDMATIALAGTWIDMPVGGGAASGIGSGGAGADPWIAVAGGTGYWFSDAATGDICIRSTSNSILFGTGTGHSGVKITSNVYSFNKNINLQAQTATPANPASSSDGNLYIKGGKLIAQYNDAGTVRYKYLDLTGTGVTWTHTTTAP